ncbi:BNR/Asp-box repeat protein [Rubripirellula obstinata]|uniref:BNR/Asp-box repeat protein n=1 Tax=Rubripirellula obstinata TaxID=406547 RepID=A0A5B1CN45_9BACT|nr:hypothetical protein [Rubripirellula obstinata]KAA1261209.1 BNR/Asp-box repeat protein [Rubripirellula obstinata]
MDGLNRVLVRTIPIFFSLAVTANPIWADVQHHPLPDYSDAQSLRGDSSLNAVAFANPRPEAAQNAMAGIGIAVGDRGALFRSTDHGETWNAVASPVDCRLLDVVWTSSRSVVVAGGAYDPLTQLSRGVVLVSRDAGASFRRINNHDLPLIRKLSLSKNRLLIANGDWSHSQLTNTFASRDGGQTWQGSGDQRRSGDPTQPINQTEPINQTDFGIADANVQSATSFIRWQRITGSPAPVRNACRIGTNQLCAVGDHGLILTSKDDGQTWAARRGGDRHAAILFVAGDAETASWSLLGSESLQWRHRCALLVEQPAGNAVENQAASHQKQLELVRQAAVMLGAASVDWFRGRDDFDEPIDRQARRWIAIHRPSVVVIDESVTNETRQAVFNAATSMGVNRVLKSSRRDHGGSLLHQSAMLPRIGMLAADLILDAQHLVAPEHCEPASISVTRLYDSNSSRIGGGGESIMAGLAVDQSNQLGGIAKSISRHRLQVVQARTKQSKLIEGLVNIKTSSSAEFENSLRQLMDQTAAEDQLRMIWSILGRTVGTRFEDLCLEEIANRFRDQSIGKWASVRIDAYRNSAEQQFLKSKAVTTTDLVQVAPAQAATVALSPFQNMQADSDRTNGGGTYQQSDFQNGEYQDSEFQDYGVRQASAVIPVGVAKPDVIQASPVSQEVSSTPIVDLQLDLHPAVLLSRLNDNSDNEEELSNASPTDPTATTMGDIRRIAMQGTRDWKRLLASNFAGRSQACLVKRAAAPPRLDGNLNDACWDNPTDAAGFKSALSQDQVQLRFASDQNYLYVAAVCPSNSIATDKGIRSTGRAARDQVLFDVDRLRLRFDTDGDLWTSHCIEITDAGRTRDSIDGDIRWQPTWYVDVHRTEQTVTFELAIRRSDLARGVGDLDARWFVSAEPIRAAAKSKAPIFPSPTEWRSVQFEQPPQSQQRSLRPAGPVRLAPVKELR